MVVAHHRVPANVRAGYIYLVMASFGTLCLLLAFGVLAGTAGEYSFAAMRAAPLTPALALIAGTLTLIGAGLEGRHRAPPCLVAARAPGSAKPRLGVAERRDDQGRGLRLYSHRVRSDRRADPLFRFDRRRHRRDHGRAGRALRAHAARHQTAARLSHRREHRHHLHRAWSGARVPRQQHRWAAALGAHRRAVSRVQPLGVQELAVLRGRLGPGRDRRARHGALGRPDPPHAANGVCVFDRLHGDLGAAAPQPASYPSG